MTLPPPTPPPPPPPNRVAAKFTNTLLSSFPFPTPPPPPPPDLFCLFAAALSFLFLLKNPISSSHPQILSFLHSNHRCRRLKSAGTMNRSTTTPASGSLPLAFSSPESLSEWLKPRLPSESFASWGVAPGTKSLHNLWLEISQGETSLLLPHPQEDQEEKEAEAPLRTVHVAIVRIRNARGALLVESHQLLSNGSVRARLRPLSEKMKPGESVEDAALRAIREELGGGAVARILPGSYEMKEEERSSASYPGLPARYVLHSVEAQVEGLPEEGEFSTEEAGECLEAAQENKAVFVRRHFWKWINDYDGIVFNL